MPGNVVGFETTSVNKRLKSYLQGAYVPLGKTDNKCNLKMNYILEGKKCYKAKGRW